jgi:hypothetical protein
MKTKIKSILSASLALILCLSLVACTQAQILTDLEIAAAAAAAVAAVPGVPPSIAVAVNASVTALDCVSAAVSAGGTAVVVSTSIAKCGLTTVGAVVPPGTATVVVAVLAALNSAILNVLKDHAAMTPAAAARAGMSGKKLSLSFGGRGKIKKIQKTLADTHAKLAVIAAGK